MEHTKRQFLCGDDVREARSIEDDRGGGDDVIPRHPDLVKEEEKLIEVVGEISAR